MKKLLLFIGLIIIFISCDRVVKTDRGYEQTGTGWKQNYTKNNFRDSSYFTKELRIGGPWRVGVTTVTTTGAQLNYSNTLTDNVQVQFNDTIGYQDILMHKHININAQTDSYTLVLTDDAKLITIDHADANNLTVPLNATVAFQVGTVINISCIGAGQTTVVATGGVTIISLGSNLAITTLGDATLVKLGTNTWKLIGSLE